MAVTPKYPPSKSCGLKPGATYQVHTSFTCEGARFTAGERLIFVRELLDVNNSCDAWIFRLPDSRREKVILGYTEYAEPARWVERFVEIEAADQPNH